MLYKVYAEDTTVYIGPDHNPKKAEECLDLFCQASTARLNNLVTEVTPLGSVESHNELIELHEFNGWKIDDEIHIAQEGEATRILGPWQENRINIQTQWNEITEK